MSPTTAATRKTERASKQKMDQYQEAAAMEPTTTTVPVLRPDQMVWITPANNQMTKFRRYKINETDRHSPYELRTRNDEARTNSITRGAFDTRTKKWRPATHHQLYIVVRGSTTFYSEVKILFSEGNADATEYMRAVVAESGFKDCTVWLKNPPTSVWTTYPFPPHDYDEDDYGFYTPFFTKLFDVGEGAEHTMFQIDDARRLRWNRERQAEEEAEREAFAAAEPAEAIAAQPIKVEDDVAIDQVTDLPAPKAAEVIVVDDDDEPVVIY